MFAVVFGLGFLVTMAAMPSIAALLRGSTDSSPTVTALLVTLSALVWPLLVIASVQIALILGLAKAMSAIETHNAHTGEWKAKTIARTWIYALSHRYEIDVVAPLTSAVALPVEGQRIATEAVPLLPRRLTILSG